MHLIPITYFLLNILHAFWHKYLIGRNRTIFSNQKTIEYSILSMLAAVILKTVLHCTALPLVLFAVLTRAAVFDTALNLMRGEKWLYEGEISRKKGFWDWLENKIRFATWVYRVVYLVAYITYLIIFLING